MRSACRGPARSHPAADAPQPADPPGGADEGRTAHCGAGGRDGAAEGHTADCGAGRRPLGRPAEERSVGDAAEECPARGTTEGRAAGGAAEARGRRRCRGTRARRGPRTTRTLGRRWWACARRRLRQHPRATQPGQLRGVTRSRPVSPRLGELRPHPQPLRTAPLERRRLRGETSGAVERGRSRPGTRCVQRAISAGLGRRRRAPGTPPRPGSPWRCRRVWSSPGRRGPRRIRPRWRCRRRVRGGRR